MRAKTPLSRLLNLTENGETVTIIRRGIPVGRLTPIPRATGRRLITAARRAATNGAGN